MITVIIPTYNEQGAIGKTIRYISMKDRAKLVSEIIVADGGSNDATVEEAEKAGAKVIYAVRKGRASQMNEGAKHASSNILYFVHADSLPPPDFSVMIRAAADAGSVAGCFRLRFDVDHWFLKANAWFTRFDINAFRFGDQSLFVSRDVFETEGGFREDHIVMEDQEMVRRLRRRGPFRILPGKMTTSSRKYLANGVYKTQGIYFLIFLMYKLGYPQATLVSTYRKLIRQDKL